MPSWAAVPGVGDLRSLIGAASDGYLVMEGVLPLPAVVPLLEMLQRQKNLEMRLLFNGCPRNLCDTHIGSRRMEDARLMKV